MPGAVRRVSARFVRAAGSSLGWWAEVVLSGGVAVHGVAVFVDFFVAFGAEEDEVGDIGGAVVVPPGDVVGVTGGGAHSAADAVLVAGVEGELLGGGGGPLLPSHVEGLPVGGEDGWEHAGIAGDVAEFVDVDGGAVDEASVLELAGEHVVVDSDDQHRGLWRRSAVVLVAVAAGGARRGLVVRALAVASVASCTVPQLAPAVIGFSPSRLLGDERDQGIGGALFVGAVGAGFGVFAEHPVGQGEQ